MHEWQVTNPEELTAEAERRGYTGLCLDLFHMRAVDAEGSGLNPWQETLPRLLPMAKEIHVAAGRVDIKQGHIDTECELRELLAGQGRTDIIPMLKAIRDEGWQGRIVTEIPAAALHSLRLDRHVSTSIKDLIEDHRRIVSTIQNILG